MRLTRTSGSRPPRTRACSLRTSRDRAVDHVYAAELQLHCARQSGIDAWASAAADKLHHALVELELADSALGHPWDH